MTEQPGVYAPPPVPVPAGAPATLPQLAQTIAAGAVSVQDIIAPPSIDVDFNHLKIGETFVRTIFVSGYPRFVGANWLSPLINFNHTLTLSMFYYPVESRGVLDDLRRKIAEMEATVKENEKGGRVADPTVEAALEDARSLQEQLVKGTERFFQFSFYITISAESIEELDAVTKKVESTLGSLLLLSKHATLRMEEAFQSTIPTCLDKLKIMRNMDTTSIATTFPLTSSELTANEGILYGINEHNGSLIIFDRFSLENANTVVFAKSGAGKSYMVKLEAIRSLMFGTEVMVIDPEKEYEQLCRSIGGDFITFSPSSPSKINPFDMSGTYEEGENELALKVLSLHTLFKVIMGQLAPSEDALIDRALLETYAGKGITQDPTTHQNPAPVMTDIYEVLKRSPGGQPLADRLEQYVTGSLKGIFDQPSTVDIRNTFTVFSTRDLEEKVRPVAMYIILDFIWSRIRREIKKRVLVVDEAWYLMQHPDSAVFMYSIAKRARKYYLGLTTITQDVADFLRSDYGKAIVTNSSLQILLKQHPAAIDEITKVFYLSEGEKRILLAANVGEGLFFAGPNHVAMQVVASPDEHPLATSSPKEILAIKEKLEQEAREKGLPTEVPPAAPAVPPAPLVPTV
ncbi:MAG: Type IV secretory pathway VirB4 component-like protein [candidate division WWE3 bacterium CSP1-7]|uniref:Type IV secretory pathway VirB4 component-like protein n=1 Tax=candidate division WWE3 bacterium CSP1-7 TaxID=1576480 RepID=A0A0T5ZYH2_UNCKA|nr:MAG: Type IV secretory pathway VirB4 component-like protein [candidate division WWE3 bacterium CSP1-7]